MTSASNGRDLNQMAARTAREPEDGMDVNLGNGFHMLV